MVTGLPRSRTAWMSVWLSAHGAPAIHEMLAKVPSWEAYKAHLGRYADCCTYGHMMDEGEFDRLVVIERDPVAVSASLMAATDDSRFHVEDWRDARLLLGKMGALRVPFEDLDLWLPVIHSFLELPAPYDELATRELTKLRVQADISAFTGDIDRLTGNAREMLGLPRRPEG